MVSVKSYLLPSTNKYHANDSKLYYDYFKKNKDGTKKEVGRLWKNMIFPGIYSEYEDTAEAKATVKVRTQKSEAERRASFREESRKDEVKFNGKYNVADERTAPTYKPNNSLNFGKLAPVKKPQGFVAPVPKKAIGPAGGIGIIEGKFPRPRKPIVLYEYEGSSDCKKVRDACAMLDLSVEIRPCPGETTGYADIMCVATKGRRDVPFMFDPNPSMLKPELYGAKEIVPYLFESYGPGVDKIPKSVQGSGSKGGKGAKVKKNARNDNMRMKPITIFGWEGCKTVTPVRKTLNELGLAHIFINCNQGSANRKLLEKRTKGVFQVPYIIDPNTGVEMFESKEICQYLDSTYTV